VPPAKEAVKVTPLPDIQTISGPESTAAVGTPDTVTKSVAANVPHILEIVYDIVAVPAATQVTLPTVLTVAMDVLLLDHLPPTTESTRMVVSPIQWLAVPIIVPLEGDTKVILLYAEEVPQAFTSV
jgi:hypothetical protein